MGEDPGFTEVAEPTSLVADEIVAAFNTGEFHVFLDTMAKQIQGAYQSYAENIVEANVTES